MKKYEFSEFKKSKIREKILEIQNNGYLMKKPEIIYIFKFNYNFYKNARD